MKTEEIVGEILSKCPIISRKQILEKLEGERRKTGGLISDETLLRMIAAEFGCEIANGRPQIPTLSLEDLIPGLNDITAVGRVVAVFSPKIFGANRKGKFASLLVADRGGILRVVLWNDKAGLVESGSLKVGQIIRFSHGYTREDYGRKVELHIGEKCEVEINPQDVEETGYPTIHKFTTRIGELTHDHRNKKVNVTGTIKKLFPATTFERRDSTSGKVMRLALSDLTGEVQAVVWNERVDELEKMLKVGARLLIVNAKVRKGRGEGLEIHVDATTYVETLAECEEFLRIADLKDKLSHVNVEGEIATKPVLRDVRTSKQELLRIATFELKDETGRIWVSAWRKHADAVSNLRLGDKIDIKNAFVRKGFGDQLELSTRDSTSITAIQ